jgi:hypothetical protein
MCETCTCARHAPIRDGPNTDGSGALRLSKGCGGVAFTPSGAMPISKPPTCVVPTALYTTVSIEAFVVNGSKARMPTSLTNRTCRMALKGCRDELNRRAHKMVAGRANRPEADRQFVCVFVCARLCAYVHVLVPPPC